MYNMKHCICLWLCLILGLSSEGVNGHKEEECVEVGFARSSYLTVDKGYQSAKEELLNTWKEEDETGFPSYKNLSLQVKNVTRAALLLEKTSQNILGLIRKTRVGKRCPEEWLLKGLEKHVTPLIQLDKELAESLGLIMSYRCLVGSPYPNVDGTCINEEGPDMGSNGAKFLRLIPPITGKGGFSIRTSVNKEKSLPSARKVAQLIRKHIVRPEVTSLFTEFSHFIALDSFSIPESPITEGVNCCQNPERTDCAPIFLDDTDPLYPTIKCFNFKRSIPAQAILGHRESLSMVSTFLDATPVYGPTNEEAFKIKEGYFGYVKYPTSIDEKENEARRRKDCQFPKSFKGCFGIQPGENNFVENLRLLLTLEHNQIADTLAEINPHFDDSLLYNEARRILIAEYDAIAYGEVIPMLVGKELAEKHTLLPGSEGPGARFIPEVNPGILTSHALASHRNPSMIDEWKREFGLSDSLSPLHYQSIRDDPYQDLLAMDIQRGRDHGLPNYGTWRSFCDSGKPFGSWEDAAAVFSEEVIKDLKDVYQDEIGDMDLLLGLLEKPETEDSLIGKTFSCILVDQFARLKTGNRLFWEHDSSMFTTEQRSAIREHSSAAGLICRHFALEKIPQNPLREVSESNPLVDCQTVPNLNLTAWVDTSLIEVMRKKKEEEEEQKKKEQETIKGKKPEDNEGETIAVGEEPEKKQDPEKVKLEERRKQEEKIKQEIIEREIKLEEQRHKEEKRMMQEEDDVVRAEEEKKLADRNKEMREAEERIKEEMKLKEEKRKKKVEL